MEDFVGRPRTPVGAYGTIKLDEIEKGKWRARTLYRFSDGRSRQVQRFGPTKGKAENVLKDALTKIQVPISSGGALSKSTKLADLAEAFLQSKRDANLAPRSIDTYEHNIQKIVVPRIGSLTVGEATVGRLQAFITTVSKEHGHGSAKGCRSVLSGMLGMAVRADVLPANPVDGIQGIRKDGPSKAAKALKVDSVPELIARLRSDPEMQRLDLADLWEFMSFVGCRIGEACALRWSFVDFEAGTITLGPSVSRIKGKGLIIWEPAKGRRDDDDRWRTVVAPQRVMDLLRKRRERMPKNELDLVFPSMLGKLRDPSNTGADWRANRDRLGMEGFKSHGFRKTVATALDGEGLTARDIAEFLGHANPSMTQDKYMDKSTSSAKMAAAIDAKFGINSES